MGLLKKKATFTILEVLEGIPSKETIIQELSNQKFVDITNTSNAEAFSVCQITDVFTQEIMESGPIVGFGIRYDKKSISKTLLKKRYKEELAKLRKEKYGSKISKEEKLLLKETVIGELYSQAKPIEKLIEVLWETKNNKIYVSSASNKIVDAVSILLCRVFEEIELSRWTPLSETTVHEQIKGSRENFQNAFFTWLFYETKNLKNKRLWIPSNIKFLGNETSITIKGDPEISIEAALAAFNSKLVESLDLGYGKEDDATSYSVSLKEGSWSFRGLTFTPDIKHEDTLSAMFERVQSFEEFLDQFINLIHEFEAIRNDSKTDKMFWDSLSKITFNHLKEQLFM